MNTIDITKLELNELKALGFDAQNEFAKIQMNLKLINEEIQKRNTQPEEVTGTAPVAGILDDSISST